MAILLFFSVLLNIAISIVCINLYRKNEQLEKVVNDIDEIEEDVIKYHRVILGLLANAYAEFQRIDKRGSFSSDDEVGWSFKLLKELIKDLTEKIELLISGNEKN